MTMRLELSTEMMRTPPCRSGTISRDYENVKAVAEAMVERDPNVLCCIKRHAPKNETPRTLNGTEVSSGLV